MKQYQINIHGHQFSVGSEYEDDHIRQVEKVLNQRIAEVSKSSNANSTQTLLLLTALNLTDELVRLRRETSGVPIQVERSLEELCRRLDQILEVNSLPQVALN